MKKCQKNEISTMYLHIAKEVEEVECVKVRAYPEKGLPNASLEAVTTTGRGDPPLQMCLLDATRGPNW